MKRQFPTLLATAATAIGRLYATRHLYERQGFNLVRTQRGSQWGREVDEQLFALGDA